MPAGGPGLSFGYRNDFNFRLDTRLIRGSLLPQFFIWASPARTGPSSYELRSMSVSRQFCFVLLATVAAFSTFGPAQNSHSPHTSAARSASSTLAAGPQPAPAAPAAGSSSQAPAPAGAPKACDHHEQWANLHRAQFEFETLRYPSAANQFSSLITSCDVWVQGESELGLQRANAAMSTWWWLEGLYFPPLRWYHHPRFWEAVGRTLLILVVILVILAFLFYWTDLVRWATGFLSVAPHRDQLRAFFLVERLPRANIMMP